MARKTKDVVVVSSQEVSVWANDLSQMAKASIENERSSHGEFFSLMGGVLSFDGVPLPNNEVCAIILHSIHENVYYDQSYQKDVITPPKCYAYSTSGLNMVPHQDVVNSGRAEHKDCDTCPNNVFGSAKVGKGKACRNSRRLALISGGLLAPSTKLFTQPEQLRSRIAFMKLPITSVKEYSAYVKRIGGVLNRPVCAVYTKIKVIPDASTQFKVEFSLIEQIDDSLIGVVLERYKEAVSITEFPYYIGNEEPQVQSKPQSKSQKRKY